MDETTTTTPETTQTPIPETPETQSVDTSQETQPIEGLGGTNPEENQEVENDFLGAPESYSNEGFNLPEGLELDDGVIDGVKDWCKENNISQKGYQGLIEKMTPVLEQRQADKIVETRNLFIRQWQQDPELGGSNFKNVQTTASKAYEKFVDPETRQLLQETGLNCHPGIVRAFYRIHQAISDDAVVRGDRPSSKNSLANFFNNSKMN